MASNVLIVTRTKDRPLFLARALRSITGQTHQDWRCVVVNDGGDATAVNDVIAQLGQTDRERISVIHNADSLGMEAASNLGLQHARADYYVIHDDDDSWAPNFLEACIATLNDDHPDSVQGVVAHTVKVQEILEKNCIIEKKRCPFLPEVTAFTIPRIVQNNPFMPIAFVYTHKALDTLGGYDESLAAVGDWEFNLRFVRKFDITYAANTTAFYHVRKKIRGDDSDNSIAKASVHEYYRTLIVNRYLREAMDQGQLTIGHLMAAAQPGQHINRLGEKLEYLHKHQTRIRLKSRIKRLWR